MTDQLSRLAGPTLFAGSTVLAALAFLEKLANLFGFTLWIVGDYPPFRLLELAAIGLLFVIALQLREIKHLCGADRE